MADETVLDMFTVYENPKDYPGKWVVRRWAIPRGGQPVPDQQPLAVCDTLEAARAAIPLGRCHLPRWHGDDPAVLETWI